MGGLANLTRLVLVVGAGLWTCAVAASPGSGDPVSAVPPSIADVLTIDPAAPPPYAEQVLPAYYRPGKANAVVRVFDDTPPYNPTTDSGALLGRVLFYDKHLSANGTLACASCHLQQYGFSDSARFSTGFTGSVFGTAHAMRLGNVRFDGSGQMFWDKRADSLEDQALQPIQNPIEMGYDAGHGGLDALIAVLGGLSYYPELFKNAFGDPYISATRISYALAQFERTLLATKSLWDEGFARVYVPGTRPDFDRPLPTFTAQQNRGLHLFMGTVASGGMACSGCHRPPTFALDGAALDNGLDAGEKAFFKAPSLKNVAVAGHYMHDGRFTTLAQVVAHYNDGLVAGPAFDPRFLNRFGQPVRMQMSQADQAALVAFLETLTDRSLLTDPLFASPFK